MPEKTVLQRLEPLFRAAWLTQGPVVAGPPSSFHQLRELTERHRDFADLQWPDVHAPPKRAPTPKPRRGRPPIHDWPRIVRLDAEFSRAFCARKNRAPTWEQRKKALKKKLGAAKTPHLKRLQRHLPKTALLKERYLNYAP